MFFLYIKGKVFYKMFHVEHFYELQKKLFPAFPELEKKFSILQELETEYFKWNNKINISAIRDQRGFWEKHILDSQCVLIYMLKDMSLKIKSSTYIYDIGSGAGFPGLVLSIFLNNPIVLVDPVNKKADYLEHVSRKLALSNIKVERHKYQDIQFVDDSLIVSRALGRYEELYNHLVSKSLKFEMLIMTSNKTLPNLEGNIVDYPYKTVVEEGISSISDHIMFHVKHL
jgi:16S rRNA (guanine527-N7)-methyltransferase